MKTKSRKQMRKELRKAKKAKKHEHFTKKKQKQKPNFEKPVETCERNARKLKKVAENVEKYICRGKKRKKFINPQEKVNFERKREKKEKEKLERDIRKQRLIQLKEENLKEDLEIKKLEKKLKMHEGKSKAFAFEGLDYLLDVCEKGRSKTTFEETFEGSDSEFDSDLDNVVKQPKETLKEKKNLGKKNTESSEMNIENYESDMGEDESSIEEEPDLEEEEEANSDFSEEKSEEEDCESEINESKVDLEKCENKSFNNDADKNKLKAPKIWEDIYGRARDEKGNVLNVYTPPHLRKKNEELSSNETLGRLRKQLKGLLNRLAESNMAFISNQVEQLYMSNSRNDMNESLWNLLKESLFSEVATPERLVAEHAMLVAVLHGNIGSEIGAHFLQFSINEFCTLLNSNPPVEDKTINNILVFILQLYNFQIFHSKLMYDIVDEVLKTLEEKQIELLLLTFRTVGFNLRKDDPLALKSLVLKVQERANSLPAGENSSRVKFMLEMLMAIKNNNMSKIPNYNPEFAEKLRKNLKLMLRKGNYNAELKISLQDLLNAEKHGRWWVVGSAWSGVAPSQSDQKQTKSDHVPSSEFSQKLLDLAKKLRMNTDIRRNIFCILMSAEDFLEAFEKLLKLKLKGAVEREIMNVLLHCALQEKNFNPYYVFLANKFCSFDRKYQMMLQCAIWDKIKELGSAMPVQVTNLAKFVGNVILEKGLPISILKVIEFSELDKPTLKFMRQVLLTILVSEDTNAVVAVFRRIADSAKLKLFRESLRLFLQHFVAKNAAKNIEEDKISRVKEKIRLAEQALTSADTHLTF